MVPPPSFILLGTDTFFFGLRRLGSSSSKSQLYIYIYPSLRGDRVRKKKRLER